MAIVKQEKVTSWLDLQMDRACEWCSSPDYMRTVLPIQVDEPLHKWQELLLDLCYCYDCVQEYHRLAEELIEKDPKYKKKFQALDIDRLAQTIIKALENPVERKVFDPPGQDVPTKLQVPLTEILRYPYFLHHEQLAAWFTKGMIALNQCGCPLKLEEKLPGAYLLLVHPDPEVRGWAVRSVRSLGLLNPDDYDLLMEVIRWMIAVVQFNLFENSGIVKPENMDAALPFEFLPEHLFVPLTRREYWLGLFVLVRQMDVSTVQTYFMSSDEHGHVVFLETIVVPMESEELEENSFWPMLQCFVVLLERLSSRIWQLPSFHKGPADVFQIITKNNIYQDSIQKWQNEGEESFSQEVSNDSQRTRMLSYSSGRFYKTAVAWFHPFVHSLLDFDSGGECVSEVVKYLHNVADCCLLQSPFKREVLSSLLRIVHDLLTKRMFLLLVPTVRLWATDVVDVAINGSVDKKYVDLSQRLLQHLLKACHRLGNKNALKYWDIFMLPGPKLLSLDDKRQIISLLIQNFENQQMQSPSQSVFQNVSKPSYKLFVESRDKTDVKHVRQGDLWRQGTVLPNETMSFVSKTTTHAREKERQSLSAGLNDQIPLADRNVGTAKSAITKATTQVREERKQTPSTAFNHHSSLAAEENRDTTQTATSSALDSQSRKRKIDPTVRSWGKPGPSTRMSEDEEDDDKEEEEYWNKVKRKKKHHLPFGNVRLSKASLAVEATPLQAFVKLNDYRKQIKGNKLFLARNRVGGTKSVNTEAKTTEKKLHGKQAAERPAKPKGKYTARKSAGRIKEYAPHRQKRGATSEDPIVLSDEEDSAVDVPEEKKPFTKDKHPVKVDNYFSDDSNGSDDVALLEVMATYEAQEQTKALGTQKLALNNSSVKAVNSSSSSLKRKDTNSISVEAQTHVSLPVVGAEHVANESNSALSAEKEVNSTSLKTLLHDSFVRKVKTELTETELDTVLYPEIREIEAGLDVDNNENSCSKKDEEEQSAVMRQDTQTAHVNIKREPTGQREEDAQTIPVTIKCERTGQTEECTSLAAISKQLENDATVDDGMNFWNDFCGYSELILNSQENALTSVEDDLEDLYSTQTKDVEEENTMFTNRDDENQAEEESVSRSYNDRLKMPVAPEETSTKQTDKHVSFQDDTTVAATATAIATAVSAGRPSGPQAGKPAITQPSKVLKEEEFFNEILSWNVLNLGNPEINERAASLPRKLPAIPVPEKTGFESMDQYYETFKPLLFMEIWEQVISSWWDKDVNKKRVFMDVLDGSASNNLSIIPCNGFISEQQQKKALFPLESDLVLVRLAVGNARDGGHMQSGFKYGKAVFGIVEKADIKTIQSPRRVSMESSGEDDVSNTTKFQLTLNIKTTSKFRPVRNSCLQVEFVTSLLTALRQWCGLMHLNRSLLACDILKPRKVDYFCSNDYQHSSLVSKEYNGSQEKVISTAANAIHKPFPIPRICLVQGPPGTGKSYTIVGLIKEILNRPQEIQTQTATGPSHGYLAHKVRILLCAPSNAAIDELIGQIAQAKICLDKRKDDNEDRRAKRQSTVKKAVSKNCGDVSLIRVGRKSHIHPTVLKFALDSITKQVKDTQSVSAIADNLNTIKDKLKTCDAREKVLEKLIWQLENSPHPDNHAKLKEIKEEKATLKNTKQQLNMKYRTQKTKEDNSRRQESRIRREILDSADIICTTLSGAGSTSLKHDLQLAGRRICPFTCVIVDEACQSTELDLLIPLEFKASKLVLVGDPEQLPPTVKSVKAKENLFGRSMFQRLYRFFRHHDMGKPVLMLEEQYRMHPEIASFPSQHVYSARLKSHSSLATRPFQLTKHYALFDVVRGQEISQERGALWNQAEVEMIVDLCSELIKMLRSESVGIITPYRKQKIEIQRRLQDRGVSRDDATIEVNTVDGFQGREKDVIILSCVRARNYRGSIGFVGDRQRMNVALTRARHALYVFGHMDTLKEGSRDWRALIEDAQKRRCFFTVCTAEDVQSVLSICVRNDSRSPAKDPRLNHKLASTKRFEKADKDTSGPAVKVDNGNHVPVPKNQRPKSVTFQERENVAVQMANETFNRKKAISTNSTHKDTSPGGILINRQVEESVKNAARIPNTNFIHGHNEEKHGQEGTRPSDRHRVTEGTSRHRLHQRDTDRHHGNHHRSKETHNEHGVGAPREHYTHRSANREHSRSGNAKQDRGQEYRHQRRPTVPEQMPKVHDDRDRSHSAATTLYSALAKSLCKVTTSTYNSSTFTSTAFQVGAREVSSPLESDRSAPTSGSIYSSNSFCNGDNVDEVSPQMDTQEYLLASVIEHHPSFDPSYFAQLQQQEKHRSKRSPSDTLASNSPTGSPRSPTEATVTSAQHHRHSAVKYYSTSTYPLERSLPSISHSTHYQASLQGSPYQNGRLSAERTSIIAPTESPRSPTEIANGPPRRLSTVTSHSTSTHPLEGSCPSVSHSTHRHVPSQELPHQAGRLSTERTTTIAPTVSLRAPTETAAISGLPRGPSTVASQLTSKRSPSDTLASNSPTGSPRSPTEATVTSAQHHRHSAVKYYSTSTYPLERSLPSISHSTHHQASLQGSPYQNGRLSAERTSIIAPTESPRSPTEIANGPPRRLSTVTSHSTSTHPLEGSCPSVSHSTHRHVPSQELPHQAGRLSTERTTTIAPTVSLRAPTETAAISGLPRGPSTVASQLTSRHHLDMSRPSGSHSTHQRTPSRGIPVTSAGFCTPSSQSSSSTLLNPSSTTRLGNQQCSPAGDHSRGRNTVIGELDPSAKQAANNVRQRQNPARPTQFIPSADRLFGGQSKRKAHGASRDAGTSTLRARANVGGPAQKRKEGNGSLLNRACKKKMSENFRGHKNWNSFQSKP